MSTFAFPSNPMLPFRSRDAASSNAATTVDLEQGIEEKLDNNPATFIDLELLEQLMEAAADAQPPIHTVSRMVSRNFSVKAEDAFQASHVLQQVRMCMRAWLRPLCLTSGERVSGDDKYNCPRDDLIYNTYASRHTFSSHR